MNQTRRQISVVIIAQNEERRIVKAVRSCQSFADEILVVDGGSSDATVEICRNIGCRVLVNAWPGYAKQRNFGADQATYDWVFFIDTDEFVDDVLANSLLAWKISSEQNSGAYAIYRIGNFLNKWLDKGEYLTRLYNKKEIRIKETLVHEAPEIPNEHVVKLEGVLWHEGFRSIDDHVKRFNMYTGLEAQKAYYEKGKTFRIYPLLWRPPARFIQQYFLHGLYRKGLAGLTVAVMWSYYEYLRFIKLYELSLDDERGRKELKPCPEKA
jgi:glycosyltransferase involved in cell wall biosynthesis